MIGSVMKDAWDGNEPRGSPSTKLVRVATPC